MAYNAREHFSFYQLKEASLLPLDSLVQSLPEQCRSPVQALIRNLRATVLTASMPYQVTFAGMWRRNFEHTLLVERIKRGRNARERALKQFRKDMESEKNRRKLAEYLRVILGQDLEIEEIRFAAGELIRECTVQVWSALEIFSRDIFVSLLNAKPNLAISLIENEGTKRLFQLKGIPFELLYDYKFNLTSNMGDLLAGYHPIDTIPSMKAVFGAILPNRKMVNDALSGRKLWLLFQRRHLIVHRRGIVDLNYLSATGEKIEVGTEIKITPEEFEKYVELVLAASFAIGTGVVTELGIS